MGAPFPRPSPLRSSPLLSSLSPSHTRARALTSLCWIGFFLTALDMLLLQRCDAHRHLS
eukprot:COSAG03_NODE_18750_length_349_cov_0.884000_1_plen_58_part_10